MLIEGFDTWAGNTVSHAEKGWQGGEVGRTTGRFTGSYAASIIPNNGVLKILPSSYSTLIVGVAMNIGVGGKTLSLSLGNAAGRGIGIAWDSACRVRLWDTTGFKGLGNSFITTNVWHFYELKVTIGGTAELRVDGVTEISAISGSWGTSFDRVWLDGDWPLPYGPSYDDLYILDTTGSANDFLGDVAVTTLLPRADGTYTEWTPDTGTDHFARVKDYANGLTDYDASYVKTTTVDARDTYFMQTLLPPLADVYGVQLNLRLRKNGPAAHTVKPLIRQGGIDYLGALDGLPSSYDITPWLLPQSPAGTDWTVSVVNNDEYGVKLIS